MASELRELYQEVILDHNKSPRNYHALASATHQAEGFNPLCGDKVTVFLRVEDGVIKEAAFVGSGCAISTASASLMTESLKNKRIEEARHLFESVHELLTGESDEPGADLGKLAVFSGVREYPMRVKCASLAWHTLLAAVDGKVNHGPATTE
jgi:nitrogen fixation protein NifU and related proteins